MTFLLAVLWIGAAFMLVVLFRSWTPLLAMLTMLAITPLILRSVRSPRWKTKTDARSSTCGYNLTGNTSGICPECGTPVDRCGK